MKSPARVALAALAAATTLCLTGCDRKQDGSHAHVASEAGQSREAETGVTFNARKGLRVPPATAKFIRLQIADVEERRIAAAFEFSAQVYRAAIGAQIAPKQSADTSAALASANVHPADAAKLAEGQSVFVRSAEGGVILSGRVVALKRDLEKASGQVEVLLVVADGPQPLALGAFVSVTASLGDEKRVLSVPRAALFRTTEGDFVYTVSGEHFTRAPVKLGVVNHEFAEIADGLYAGDQIVVQPVMTLWLAELQTIRGGKSCVDGH